MISSKEILVHSPPNRLTAPMTPLGLIKNELLFLKAFPMIRDNLCYIKLFKPPWKNKKPSHWFTSKLCLPCVSYLQAANSLPVQSKESQQKMLAFEHLDIYHITPHIQENVIHLLYMYLMILVFSFWVYPSVITHFFLT